MVPYIKQTLNSCEYVDPSPTFNQKTNHHMISSLLPRPKHAAHETIPVILPKPKSKFTALLPTSVLLAHKPEQQVGLDPTDLEKSKNPQDYSQRVVQITGSTGVVQTSYEDTIPLKVRYPHLKHHFPRYTLSNCPDDSLSVCLEETRDAINKLIAQAEGTAELGDAVTVVEMTTDGLHEEDSRGRTVEIRNYQEDPMLPPKFKLRKNRHKNPSPPPPILKAGPTEKVTKELKDKWKIPSAVSNWKNNQGFAISLGKRVVAASGGSLSTDATINVEKFGELSLALNEADKQAREEISIRNEQRKEAALREQQEKQQQLKALVERSRIERNGPKRPAYESYNARKRSRR